MPPMTNTPPSPEPSRDRESKSVERFTQEQLVFVISAPRSGSTLLQRMLGSHSEVFTHPEPHMITPMAHLGLYGQVDRAPYDHINAAEAMRSFVEGLPRGEEDYLDALRAYSDTLYARMLATSGRSRFLDKTPAYGLVLPFLTKLYPRARYVVLTRHPLAIFSSYANSFFDGDWRGAHDFNPIVERYVAAIGQQVRAPSVPLHHIRYEELVADPEPQLAAIFEHLGLPHEPGAVVYGRGPGMKKGMGDPIGVAKHDRPVTHSIEKWATELAGDPVKLELARRMIDGCLDEDLEAWGWPRAKLWEPLEQAGAGAPPARVLNRYTLQRRVLLLLRKDVDRRWHGKLIRQLKYYCDVILRDRA